MKKCTKCGTEILDDSLFCHKCGNSVTHSDTSTNNVEHRPIPIDNINKSVSEDIPMPKLIKCIGFGFLSLILIGSFIIGIQVSFLLGVIIFILCFIFVCGTIFEISDYRLAKKDFELYKQKKQKEQEEKEKQKIEKEERQKQETMLRIKRSQSNSVPTCPRCGSHSIATVNRGYSIVWGFIGSGKPMNVCQKCGRKWKPGS